MPDGTDEISRQPSQDPAQAAENDQQARPRSRSRGNEPAKQRGKSARRASPVGVKQPSWRGLFDMLSRDPFM